MPKVSVIIPTLNRPTELTCAITSALNQSFRDLEVIVVADEPNSATLQVLVDLKDQRLRHVSNPKRVGLAEARNIGVRESTAPWIAFLDDDDEWLVDKIEKQMAVAQTLSSDYVFVVSKYFDRSATRERIWPEELPKSTARFSEYMFCKRGMLLPSTFFVSRALMVDVPFRKGSPNEDIEWMLQVTADPRTQLGVVESPLVIYNNFVVPQRGSVNTVWQTYYSWAIAHRQLFTPLAFSMFISKSVVMRAREGRASNRELLHLLSASVMLGKFSFRALFYFFASSVFSRETKQKVRELLSPAARRSRVMIGSASSSGSGPL